MSFKKFNLNHYINYIVIGILTVVLSVITMTGGRLDSSLLFLLEKIAISIILAVSLSLVVGFLGELSLFRDQTDDFFFTFIQIAQIGQAFVQIAENHVGQSTGHFFTITGDERNGVPFIDQVHGGFHLRLFQMKLRRQFFYDIHSCVPLYFVTSRSTSARASSFASSKRSFSATQLGFGGSTSLYTLI